MIELKDLQLPSGVKDKDLIEAIKELYPKYDKTLHSKCKQGQKYGITLREDALKSIIVQFAPRLYKAPGAKKPSGHRYTRRISCRLPDEDYNQLQLYIKDDGYQTVQDWLSDQYKAYIRFKERSKLRKEKTPCQE